MSSRAPGTAATTSAQAATACVSCFCGDNRAITVARSGSRDGSGSGAGGVVTGLATTCMLVVRPRRSPISSRWRAVSVTKASTSLARLSTRRYAGAIGPSQRRPGGCRCRLCIW